MTRQGAAGRSAGLMVVAQAFIIFVQIFYVAITSRLVSPAEFGGFAAALSLMGLLALLTTTGIPSFVYRAGVSTRRDRWRVRLLVFLGSALAAGAHALIAPWWLNLLNAPSGAQFVTLLVIAQVLSPIAAIEFALIRVVPRPAIDAMLIALPAVLASAISAIGLITTANPAWLAAAPVLNSVLTLVGALSLRAREAPSAESTTGWRALLLHSATVTVQNSFFFAVQQAPVWLTGALLGASGLGQLNRSQALTSMVAQGASAAIARGLQPHWRDVSETEIFASRVRQLIHGVGTPVVLGFAVVGSAGGSLLLILMGTTWLPAAWLVPSLALLGATQVVFAVVANAFESTGRFRPIRGSQVAMAVAAAPAVTLAVVFPSLVSIATGFAFVQVVGAVHLLVHGAMALGKSPTWFLAPLARAVAAGSGGFLLGWLVARMLTDEFNNTTAAALWASMALSIAISAFIGLAGLGISGVRGIRRFWGSRGSIN